MGASSSGFACIIVIVSLALFICEYLIYYVVINQCSWPSVGDGEDEGGGDEELRAMFIADTHLLGPYRGHWFDKLRREWQMYRAFQSSVNSYRPDAVFILGDLFDEGQNCNEEQFNNYVERFWKLFEVPKSTKLYAVPGNHDLGFHYRLRYDLYSKFNSVFNTSGVELKNIRGNYFVLINSMALHRDDCYFCSKADYDINRIADKLNCLKSGKQCTGLTKLMRYTRPIVLQHFPMYRKSDEICNEEDEAPSDMKKVPFREKWECLSKESSDMIYDLLNPRLILTGHTHHGCKVRHRCDIYEYTLSSFNWRNKDNPTFMLGVFTPDKYSLTKCHIPKESTVIYIYLTMIIASLTYLIIKVKTRVNGRSAKFEKAHF